MMKKAKRVISRIVLFISVFILAHHGQISGGILDILEKKRVAKHISRLHYAKSHYLGD